MPHNKYQVNDENGKGVFNPIMRLQERDKCADPDEIEHYGNQYAILPTILITWHLR